MTASTPPATDTPKEVSAPPSTGTLLSTPPAPAPEAAPPATPAQDAPKPDAAYEIKAPEGQSYDASVLSVYTDTAKELGIAQDAAQKLIDKLGPAVAARQQEQIATLHTQWVEETKADAEIGGSKLQETLGYAQKALTAFGSDSLRSLLEQSGLGSHREIVALLARAGRAISEDKLLTKGTSVVTEAKPSAQDFNSVAARMYPKHAPTA